MTRVLLIKVGALGDVLRTTCLVKGIRTKWPGAQVTWCTGESAVPLLARNPGLAGIWTIEAAASAPFKANESVQSWDVLINLDEDPRATLLASTFFQAAEKYGVNRDGRSRLVPLSPESEHLVRLATDDRLKFRENQMPFQAIIYQAIGLTWSGEPYVYVPPPDLGDRLGRIFPQIRNPKSEVLRSSQKRKRTPAKEDEIQNPKRVGVFVGASDRYANKFWSEREIAEFCAAFPPAQDPPVELFLFGGPAERDRIERLRMSDACRSIPAVCVDDLDDLASVVAACGVLVCGDTLAMHLAQAMGVPMAVLFGPTAHAEISITGRKIVSPYACGPCYLRECDITPSCMSVIRPARVLSAIEEIFAF